MSKPLIQRNDTEEQLLLLRDMTQRTGLIHEAQRIQLQYWPLVLFSKAKNTECRLNIDKKDAVFVIQQKGNADDAFKQACETLTAWVRWLLGDDWIVRVKLRDKQIFRSKLTDKKQ